MILAHDSLPIKQITDFQCDLPPMHICPNIDIPQGHKFLQYHMLENEGPFARAQTLDERLWVFRPTHESWPSNVMIPWLQSVQRPALC
jgi:hypothetical protein